MRWIAPLACVILLPGVPAPGLAGPSTSGAFVRKLGLPSGQTLVVSEGHFEPRSIGSFSVLLYDRADQPVNATAFFRVGLIRSRDGSIDKVVLHDLSGDGNPEVIVIVRSAGSGGYLSAHAFRVDPQHLSFCAAVEGLASDADPVAALRSEIRRHPCPITAGPCGPGAAACAPGNDGAWLEREALGPIRIGARREGVLELLGEAPIESPRQVWGSDGRVHQSLAFPARGLTLGMVSDALAGPQVVASILARPPCTFSTRRGIRIGSSEADVQRAYGAEHNAEEGRQGSLFVAGSFFGGLTFTLRNGSVAEIVLGAVSE